MIPIEGKAVTIETKIERLEPHMLLIRRVAGWSAAVFGEKIGVSRQTINNLESGRSHLSKTEYLLIRRVLDDEIDPSADEPSMLQVLLKVLVDHPEDYSDEVRNEVLSKAKLVARSVITKPEERKAVSKEWKAILIAGGVLAAATIALIWGKKDK